jgi:hypothetical protein
MIRLFNMVSEIPVQMTKAAINNTLTNAHILYNTHDLLYCHLRASAYACIRSLLCTERQLSLGVHDLHIIEGYRLVPRRVVAQNAELRQSGQHLYDVALGGWIPL